MGSHRRELDPFLRLLVWVFSGRPCAPWATGDPPGRLRAFAAAVTATLLLTAGCTARDDDPPPAGSPSATAAPGATAPAPAADGPRNPFGAHWDWSRYQQFAPYLRRIAGSATYEEISWCEIERSAGSRTGPGWTRSPRAAGNWASQCT
ncbi:hypothetical protein NKG94_14920 [Micromonospora sp. M12]